jgi:trk system potassium uptake protein TrkA
MIDRSRGEIASALERVLGYTRRDRRIGRLASAPANKALVIGLGRFGSAVCATLVDSGVEVMAVDIDETNINKWVDVMPHLRLADTTDPATLNQLGVADFDATVVAIGSGIEASVLTVGNLSDAGAVNIWAKATTPEHGRILTRVGADRIVYPEGQMGERVGRIVSGAVVDFFELDDHFVLAEVVAPDFLVSQRLGDSDLRGRFNVSAVCIKPVDGLYTYATADTVPTAGSFIVVAGQVADVNRLTEAVRQAHRG